MALKHHRGFSLVELLVVTAVVVIVSAAVLSNHAKFGTTVVLERLAYDIGLALREAQTYGISVFRSNTGEFAQSYGIYFLISSPNSFVLFADTGTSNGIYDTGETIEMQTLPNGYSITSLCATPGTGEESCTNTRLDVAFSRPDPDALIRVQGLPAQLNSARIVVKSPQNDTRSIIIEASGQIHID